MYTSNILDNFELTRTICYGVSAGTGETDGRTYEVNR